MKQTKIAVSKLRSFENNPYQVRDDAEMNTLIESIQMQGVLSPLIVRPIENTDEYEVVSGHRRLHAARKAGITEVPALIYALDRDTAAIAVVDSNLHREHSRNDVLPAHPVNEEVRRPLEVGRYLLWGLALEKLRAGGNQRVHKPSAVLAGAASGLLDAALNEW